MKFLKNFICILFILLTVNVFISSYNKKINSITVKLLGKLVYVEANADIQSNTENDKLLNATYQNTGIVTCIDNDNRFISIGHSIANGKNVSGKCYQTRKYDIEKSEEGNIGNLITNVDVSNQLGSIENNTKIGVTGEVSDRYNFNGKSIKLGSRFEIKNGKAKLYLDLENVSKKYFDIEITSVNYLSTTKNIGIKVVDEDLINLTGGLVKGMSGTPIIQDGKLIGVFSCILQSDQHKGYGVFIDKFF